MRMRALLVCLMILIWIGIRAEERLDLRNHFSLSFERDQKHQDSFLELNWQPQLRFSYPVLPKLEISGEYSMQNRLLSSWMEGSHTSEIKLVSYRWWLRLATDQTQVIAGLQRLNFGSAMILRPLRWFDTIDPLDANQETQGAQALLLKHNWLSNANLWLWASPGTDEIKGSEILPGNDKSVELGGRLQVPNPIGETAISYHQRQLSQGREYRMGLDHRIDTFMGLWLEASASRYQDVPVWISPYSVSATIGGDYTVGIGNGIAIVLENMVMASGDELSQQRSDATLSSLMSSYPLGLLDNLTMLGTWNWKSESGNLSLMFRRTYDYLSIDLGLSLDTGLPQFQSRSPLVFLKVNYDL